MSHSHLCIPRLLFSKQNYDVLSPSSYTHISVRDLYISSIVLPILLQVIMWTDPGNIYIAHRHMNVEIRNEATQFPEKEYINGIFLAVQYVSKKFQRQNFPSYCRICSFTGYSSHPVRFYFGNLDWCMKWLGMVDHQYLAYILNLRTPPSPFLWQSPLCGAW